MFAMASAESWSPESGVKKRVALPEPNPEPQRISNSNPPNCAPGWVHFGGGTLEQEWRVDGGCFISPPGISRVQDCDAAWSICAELNSMLAYKRSYQHGTMEPLTVRELKNLVPRGSRPRRIGNSSNNAYVCVTKYDGYTPTEANMQRSRNACSTTR